MFRTVALSTVVFLIALLRQDTTVAQSTSVQTSNANSKPSTYQYQGVLEAYRDTDVATAEVGVVQHLRVKLGDVVESGQAVGELTSDQQRIHLDEAEAEAASQGQLEGARREFEYNHRKFEETQKLVADGKASARELERHRLELGIAKAKVLAQEETKRISQVRLEKARTALQERTILAPHEGVVVEIHRSEGEYIAGNSPALVRIVDTSKLRARFFLSEESAERLRARKEVEVRLSNNVVAQATIEYIAPVANADGRVIEMTVLLDNPHRDIRSSYIELVQP